MHKEENSPFPLSEEIAEVGDGVPPSFSDGISNFEIEERVIAKGRNFDYTREELKDFADNDTWYQKLKAAATTQIKICDAEEAEIKEARIAAKEAFLHYQRLVTHRRVMVAEANLAYRKMYHQMINIAARQASRSIKRIQKILGIAELDVEKAAEKSLRQLFVRRTKQPEETPHLSQEQSDAILVPLSSGSTLTTNSEPTTEETKKNSSQTLTARQVVPM